jgi:hypothetical protein
MIALGKHHPSAICVENITFDSALRSLKGMLGEIAKYPIR